MIRTAIVAVAAALLVSAASTALSFQDLPDVQIGLDVNTAGNSGNVLGPVDTCLSVNQGDTFDVDVTVKGIPPISNFNLGLAGYGINLHFDPAVVNVLAVNNKMIIQSLSTFEFIAANYTLGGDPNDFPGTSGDTRVDNIDLGRQDSSGDGVLARFTLKAVGPGETDLKLDSELEGRPYPVTFGRVGANLNIYSVDSLQNARVTVGKPCTNPPTATNPAEPTPTESAITPTPSPSVSRAPAGDTKLAIDTVITGNEATKPGNIDECARANVGDTFQIDVVIKGVKDLLAWELPLSYDPQLLRVIGRDVKLFQQSNSGSQVLDASAQTPDNTGVYVAAAADTSDPVTPDSGDGVLVRIKMEALKDGTSKLSLNRVDINGDRTPDRGVLLRNIDNAIIGDTNGDTFFDGPIAGAEIRVGADCSAASKVVADANGGQASSTGEGSGTDTWVYVAIAAAVVAVVAAAGAGLLLMRRRGRSAAP